MRAALLLVVVLLAFCAAPAFSQGGPNTFCGKYAAALFTSDTPATEAQLLTAIVTRAVTGGSGTGYNGVVVLGLFNSSGPLYNIFSGITQYRTGAPNYTDTSSANFMALAGHLTSYFGALFGCQVGVSGGLAAVHSSDMYGVHQNMGITGSMETYFVNALANTLASFGVSSTDIGTAGGLLANFNRYGVPIQSATTGTPNYISNSTSNGLTQVCGDSSCPLATTSNAALYPSGASTVQVSVGLIAALIALVSVLAL